MRNTPQILHPAAIPAAAAADLYTDAQGRAHHACALCGYIDGVRREYFQWVAHCNVSESIFDTNGVLRSGLSDTHTGSRVARFCFLRGVHHDDKCDSPRAMPFWLVVCGDSFIVLAVYLNPK